MPLSKEDTDRLIGLLGDVIRKFEPGSQPVPDPVFYESADGTRGTTIIDGAGRDWTIRSDEHLLRNGHDTGGMGSIYLYRRKIVYTLGTDGNWYDWFDTIGSWVFYGPDPDGSPTQEKLASKVAVNLSSLGFWGNQDPFINRLKRASRWWHRFGVTNDKYTDPRTQWLHGLPPGESLTNLICVPDIGGDLDFTEQRAGIHHLMWQGDLQMLVDGAGADPGAATKGRYTFPIPATIAGNLANPALSMTLTNPTDKPQDFVSSTVGGAQYPALVHADDIHDFMDGNHYTSRFKDSLKGYDYVRTMDLNLCPMQGVANDGTVKRSAIGPMDFLDDSCRTYVPDDSNSYFFPPEEIGCLAREADIGIFNTMPSKCTDEAFDYWAQRFAGAAGKKWNGRLKSELGDENWNTSWPWNIGGAYLRDVIATTIKVVDIDGNPSTAPNDQLGCAAASRALAMWAAMEKFIPREQHDRVLGGQFAYTAALGGMLAYVDPVTGQPMHELADEYAVAPYWGADRSDGLTLDTILQDKLWLKGDQYWIDRCKKNIDDMRVATLRNQQFLAKYAPKVKLTCYEGGGWLWDGPRPAKDSALWTASKDFDNFCRAFMDGDAGKTVTAYYWDTFIKGNFLLLNHYTSVGYAYGTQMGVANSLYRADTPRQALLRTLGK